MALTCDPAPQIRQPGWIAPPDSGFARGIVENAQDIAAIESVLPEAVVPACIHDCLVRAAQLHGDAVAIKALGGHGDITAVQSISYAEYLGQVTAAANLFRGIAGGAECVVAVMLPIVPEALVATWAGVTAGKATPINPHLEPALVASILRSVNATVLITSTAYGPSAADRLDDIVQQAPSLQRVLMVGKTDRADAFCEAIAPYRQDSLTFTPLRDRNAEAMYLPTGGTTAAPKLARLTHGGIVLSGWIAGAIMGSEQDEVIGLGMPLFHVGGMLMLGGRALVLAQSVLMLSPAGFRDRSVVDKFWQIAKVHGMTSLIATPTTAAAIHARDSDDHHGHVIRTFSSGGSTVPLELGRSFPRRFGVELREVWGGTEFHGFLGCQPNGGKPLIGSVGKRTPWHAIKAVELDAQNRFVREMPPGEQGVIIGSGPCLALGYADPNLDSQFFVAGMPDGRVWGSSGDLGRVDADGWVWIDGRAKDVIIRGGHNIDPALIEELLVTHPAVLHAAAIGYPDMDKGELPVAYVELVAGQVCPADELLHHCRAGIQERAACPVAIHILDSMPLTPVGKIFKPALRERALRSAVTETLARICGTVPDRLDVQMAGSRPAVLVDLEGIPADRANAALAELRRFSFEIRTPDDAVGTG